jgi:cytidylate kinase
VSNASTPATCRLVVAIDGPAGAGKSTIAKACARALGYTYIDTGAMYRAVGLLARRANLDFADAAGLADLVADLDFDFPWVDGELHTIVNGEDVSVPIRTPQGAMDASTVSKVGSVRDALVALQRLMGRDGGVVMEGRDIGTVVFPAAELKIFLTASPAVRGSRRFRQMRARGQEAVLEDIITEIERRDEQDSNRPISPLRAADDSVHLDTSDMQVDDVLNVICGLAGERGAALR